MAHTLPGFQVLISCIQYLASHPHKPIFNISNYSDGSNITRLTQSGIKIEDYTSQKFLECHQEIDHAIILKIRQKCSGIIHTLLGIVACWKLQIQLDVSSESTYEQI